MTLDPKGLKAAREASLAPCPSLEKTIRAYLSAAPSGQAPIEGVKALEWEAPTAATNGCWTAKSPFGTYSAVNEGGWYVSRDDTPRDFYFEWCGQDMSSDTLHTAQAAAQADFEARIRSALLPASAEPVAHPLAAFPDGIVPGLYIVHWKSGGTSKAAIGMLPNGNRWIAPTNWVRPGTWPAADEWHDIDHVEPVLADDPPASGAVEAGWQLVPKEPTEAMLDAYWNQCGESKEMRSRTHAYGKRYYAAMLAAAPTEGKEEGE